MKAKPRIRHGVRGMAKTTKKCIKINIQAIVVEQICGHRKYSISSYMYP